MFVGCFIILIGTTVIASSNSMHQFIGGEFHAATVSPRGFLIDIPDTGRFVLGMGIAIAITAAPTYMIEVSPPQWRGRMTSLYNTFVRGLLLVLEPV